ncbi:Golgin subfamily A member 7/ERF4 family-domain-containing protein [Phycomyces nitens]|nr:Golgin subfamily A member 7/ERF4 family-domain-containing protein [Phycomyces nitens]
MAFAFAQSPPHSQIPPALEHVIRLSDRVPTGTIRVERDYSKGDGITQFATTLPLGLEGRIEPELFQSTIKGINEIMSEAEAISFHNVLDNVMECLTVYTWPLIFGSKYQKSIKRLQSYLQSENQKVYHLRDLSITNPVPCAFLFLEIKTFDT